MQPVVPFEPTLAERIPQGPEWVYQVKWDGVRILTYYDHTEVRLFNRKLHERTLQFPELLTIERYCHASSVILDGELIAFDQGKPSFFEIMKRDSTRKASSIETARKTTPVTYMLFDLLYYNGRWVTDQPLSARQRILSQIITPQPDVQPVENFVDGHHLFAAIKAQNMEGIVCKNLTSTYGIDTKDNRWQKVKNYQDVIAVIGGFTLRGATVNAVLLGLYDEAGKFRYIGHAGTGKLTDRNWQHLTQRLIQLTIPERPFINLPERQVEAHWVQPIITLKVQFSEWTPGKSLRQPSIQAFIDVPPDECRF